MANETTIIPNTFTSTKITFLGQVLVVCHLMLHQMKSIRQIFFIYDRYKTKVHKCVLNVVDVASRYKGSYQLMTKNSKEVAQAFQWIYANTLLTYPKTLIIDNGKEFYGERTKLMGKHDMIIQRGDTSQHRSQGIVERFNRTLADRLFSYQHHKELEDPSKSNRE